MAPKPFRGKLNEPSYVRYAYEAVAAARGVALEALAGQVEENARTFFGWGSSHV